MHSIGYSWPCLVMQDNLDRSVSLEYNEPAAEGLAFPIIIMFVAQPPAVMISVHMKKFITHQTTGVLKLLLTLLPCRCILPLTSSLFLLCVFQKITEPVESQWFPFPCFRISHVVNDLVT
jgi:hypothetical protein